MRLAFCRMPIVDPAALLGSLRAEPHETEWLEFKNSYFDPDDIGRYISALANSAMLVGKEHAYLVFGVEDGSHKVVGTSVSLKSAKKGAEPLENWLSRMLDPQVTLEIVEFAIDGKAIVIVRIDPAYRQPVAFNKVCYVRIGSSRKELREYPERERQLWHATSRYTFEQGIAAPNLSAEMVVERFACSTFMELIGRPEATPHATIEFLQQRELIVDNRQGRFDVTNLFALAAARDLDAFPMLSTKAPRVIVYNGNTRLEAKKDQTGRHGYAVGFKKLLSFIMDEIPQREFMQHGLRAKEYDYPEVAIRELLANALVHQDFTVPGAPRIEIFDRRIEITSLGVPLIPVDRFIDAPPRTRNSRLAKLLRDMGLCEERGSGIDRALMDVEKALLPPPMFVEAPGATVVTLFSKKEFAVLSREERLRACYQHACLRFLSGEPMSNQSLRRRFGLGEKRVQVASQIIAESIDAGLIIPQEVMQSTRNARYLPVWAKPSDFSSVFGRTRRERAN